MRERTTVLSLSVCLSVSQSVSQSVNQSVSHSVSHSVIQQKVDLEDGSLQNIEVSIKMLHWTF